MIRWKTISLLFVSVALVSSACNFLYGGDTDDAIVLAEKEQAIRDSIEELAASEDGQAEEDAAAEEAAEAEDEEAAEDEEDAEVPPDLDPRAHIVSIESYVTDDGTLGFIVGFAKEWDGIPELYSFFVELVFTVDGASMTAGLQTHAGAETTWGGGVKLLLNDGKLALETNIAHNPDDDVQVTGRSGSQKTSDSKVVSDTYPESNVSTDNATTLDPSRVVVVLDEGTPENLKAAQPTAASNDGRKITITFAGNLKALVDGGAYKVRINAQARDGGIRVTVTLRSTDGELLLNGTTFNDADKVGSSTPGKDVETTWVWSPDGNEVVIDMVSPDGVAIPSTSVKVSVEVQEQESSPQIDLNL